MAQHSMAEDRYATVSTEADVTYVAAVTEADVTNVATITETAVTNVATITETAVTTVATVSDSLPRRLMSLLSLLSQRLLDRQCILNKGSLAFQWPGTVRRETWGFIKFWCSLMHVTAAVSISGNVMANGHITLQYSSYRDAVFCFGVVFTVGKQGG